MFIYGLSRKQCGVIFANIKNGNLVDLPVDFCNWMYNRISDARAYVSDSKDKDVFDRMRNGLDLVFAHDYEAAHKALSSAYDIWHVYFSEN